MKWNAELISIEKAADVTGKFSVNILKSALLALLERGDLSRMQYTLAVEELNRIR